MKLNHLFSKKQPKNVNKEKNIMKMNSEVDNDYFFRQDFTKKSKISDIDEIKVENLVRLYNAELILLCNWMKINLMNI